MEVGREGKAKGERERERGQAVQECSGLFGDGHLLWLQLGSSDNQDSVESDPKNFSNIHPIVGIALTPSRFSSFSLSFASRFLSSEITRKINSSAIEERSDWTAKGTIIFTFFFFFCFLCVTSGFFVCPFFKNSELIVPSSWLAWGWSFYHWWVYPFSLAISIELFFVGFSFFFDFFSWILAFTFFFPDQLIGKE